MQLKLGIEEALASTARNSTAQYSILATCNKCAGVHETGISITMEHGPVDKQSIGDFYTGKSLPKNLASLSSTNLACHLTGRQFIQKDTKQIFLVRIKRQPTTENDARRNRKGRG
jgi:hypothetical protein